MVTLTSRKIELFIIGSHRVFKAYKFAHDISISLGLCHQKASNKQCFIKTNDAHVFHFQRLKLRSRRVTEVNISEDESCRVPNLSECISRLCQYGRTDRCIAPEVNRGGPEAQHVCAIGGIFLLVLFPSIRVKFDNMIKGGSLPSHL